MTNITISGITETQFAERIHATLEAFSGSPIVKRKDSIVKKAMVNLLHGGNGAGQNEHNLSQFFTEKNAKQSLWITQENYAHESDNDEMMESYEANTEEDSKKMMFESVLCYLADWVEMAIDVADFEEHLDVFEENPVTLYLKENEMDVSTIEGYEVAEMIKEISSNASYIVLFCMFEYITSLSCIKGSHSTKEVQIETVQEEKKDESLTLYMTKIIYLSEDNAFDDESRSITDFEIQPDRSESQREERLSKLLYQHIPDEDMSAQYLLDKTFIEDLLERERKNADHFSHASTSDILDWALSIHEASDLIHLIEEMTDGMIQVSTYNDYI